MYQGSPEHFSTQYHWMILISTGALEEISVPLPFDLLTSVSVSCPAFSEAQEVRVGVLWYLLQSSNSLVLFPTDFWAQHLSGVFTHDESRYCDKEGVMALGDGLPLAELSRACLRLARNKRIKIWYTFLEILPIYLDVIIQMQTAEQAQMFTKFNTNHKWRPWLYWNMGHWTRPAAY